MWLIKVKDALSAFCASLVLLVIMVAVSFALLAGQFREDYYTEVVTIKGELYYGTLVGVFHSPPFTVAGIVVETNKGRRRFYFNKIKSYQVYRKKEK